MPLLRLSGGGHRRARLTTADIYGRGRLNAGMPARLFADLIDCRGRTRSCVSSVLLSPVTFCTTDRLPSESPRYKTARSAPLRFS
jgi:hypothetical protein